MAKLLQLLHERGVAHAPPAHDDLGNTGERQGCVAAGVRMSNAENGFNLRDSEARVLHVQGDAVSGQGEECRQDIQLLLLGKLAIV